MSLSLSSSSSGSSIDSSDQTTASSAVGVVVATTPAAANNNGGPSRRAALEPCVAGATIAQERKWLEMIRLMALDVDDTTLLAPGMRATEFAFLYVREDRTKRQANIRRCKENSKQRKQQQQRQQQQLQQQTTYDLDIDDD